MATFSNECTYTFKKFCHTVTYTTATRNTYFSFRRLRTTTTTAMTVTRTATTVPMAETFVEYGRLALARLGLECDAFEERRLAMLEELHAELEQPLC